MAASQDPLGGERRAAGAALCPCARAWVGPGPAPAPASVHAPRRPLRRSLSLPPRPPPPPPPRPVTDHAPAAVAVTLGPPPAYDDHRCPPPPEPYRLAIGHPEPPPPYSPAEIFCVSTARGECFDSLPVARQPAPCRYADERRSKGVYCCVLTWTVVLLGVAVAQYFFF